MSDMTAPWLALMCCSDGLIGHVVHSKQASTYDSRHQKTLDKIVDDIRSHLNFIGDDWASDDDDSDSDDEQSQTKPKRPVRLLDYACGTGTISRVGLRRYMCSGHLGAEFDALPFEI
jgi:hypothetical protein